MLTDRIDYMLRCVYKEIGQFSLFETEDDFVEYHKRQAYERKHGTHMYLEFHESFYRGGEYRESGVVELDFLEYIKDENPTLELGEVDGKHSDVSITFKDFLSREDRDLFTVNSNMPKGLPECLVDVKEQYDELKKKRFDILHQFVNAMTEEQFKSTPYSHGDDVVDDSDFMSLFETSCDFGEEEEWLREFFSFVADDDDDDDEPDNKKQKTF